MPEAADQSTNGDGNDLASPLAIHSPSRPKCRILRSYFLRYRTADSELTPISLTTAAPTGARQSLPPPPCPAPIAPSRS